MENQGELAYMPNSNSPRTVVQLQSWSQLAKTRRQAKVNPDASVTLLSRYFLLVFYTESAGVHAVNPRFTLFITVRDVTPP